jgi:type I restriction enzyme S subunit
MGEFESVPKGYKKTEVGVIPEDWEVMTLSNVILSLIAGVSVNLVTDESNQSTNEKSILKTSSIYRGKFFPNESKKIFSQDIHRAKVNPRANSIIFSRMNTPELVGECGYIDKDYPDLFLPDRLWITEFNRLKPAHPKWLSLLLSDKPFSQKIKELATGTSNSMKNISKEALLSIQIPFPPTPLEQSLIAEALSDADAMIEGLERSPVTKPKIGLSVALSGMNQ